ncbi:MAG: Asp-tRNA(Asn)/Glu-tRNA(Gln) amidotransferase subunit GatC [Alphaproteobacteria bacterium]|nr:MAG: Asp-tRNA(Asn)/Glu-tRNA(Gln) amidotransferase subunit GatC [Alphaproteobacteria bacterium]
MSVDTETVRRIAHLARIAVKEEALEPMTGELNTILDWVEQLGEVNTEGVEPMTRVVDTQLRWRQDEVTDGGYPERVTKNAPDGDDGFFTVPKVVE